MCGLRNDMGGWLYIEVAGFSGHVIPARANRLQKACHPRAGLCGGVGSMLFEAVHQGPYFMNRRA